MLKVLGIVAEYNPFHMGHLYHLQKAQEIVNPNFTIALMSGNFTQRGEPAIVDKWARTQMALKNGIDLVLELPTLYACQTAELFASGAVQILHHTGLVTHMAFGSEYTDSQDLKRIARILVKEPPKYKELLRTGLNKGLSFPSARLEAIKKYLLDEEQNTDLSSTLINTIMSGSNSILALEYLKALLRLNSPIEPVIIPRIGSSYNELGIKGKFSSATAIRNIILSGRGWESIIPAIPNTSLEILKEAIDCGRGPISLHSFEQLLLALVRRASSKEIATWMDVEEGLENRIKKFALESTNIEDFLLKTKTKRYTYTRLQRILIHGILTITRDNLMDFESTGGPRYLRILGFNTRSTSLLNKLKETSHLPIITKPSHYYHLGDDNMRAMFQYDILATDLYSLAFPNKEQRMGGQELTQGVMMI